MNSKNFFLSVAALICGAAVSASPASAVPITLTGVPVAGFGSTTQVASLNGDGFLPFFIPLSQQASGTFTVNGAGTVSDSGNGGGSLTMTIGFGIVDGILQDAKLILDFQDLDIVNLLDPTNTNDYIEPPTDFPDNNQFFESVRIYSSNGFTTNTITSTGDTIAGVIDVRYSGQNLQQIVIEDLSAFLPANGQPIVIGLEFTSFNGIPLIFGTNSPEFARSTLSATLVPEPATMLLLGSSAIVGAAARRRKRA